MSGVGPTFGQLLHFVSREAVRLLHVLERRLGEAAYLAEEYGIFDIGAFTWVNFAFPIAGKDSGGQL
jgi:GST-like protein